MRRSRRRSSRASASTWDLTGAGTTVLHASAGYVPQRPARRRQSRQPERQSAVHPQPDLFRSAPSARLLGRGRRPRDQPAGDDRGDRDGTTRRPAPTTGPPACGATSGGARRWTRPTSATSGATSRCTTTSTRSRTARGSSTCTPENRDPTQPNAALPPAFLRPYRGYQNIRTRGNSGNADYHSFQLQVNRRYIRGIQFGGNYTLAAGARRGRRGSRATSRWRSTDPMDFHLSSWSRTARRTTSSSITPGISPEPPRRRGRAPAR